MKKITEKQLLENVLAFNNILKMMEDDRSLSWQNVGKAAGNVWQGAKNTAGAIGNAVTGAADAVTGAATGAVDAITGAASDMARGFDSAQTPTQSNTTAAMQSTKPVVHAKPDPKVKELQNKLIAAGAKITADGIMGPKTQTAMQQFPQAAGTNPMAQTSDEAEDERIAQNQAFYNMTPAQQASYNAGAVQQDAAKAAAAAKTSAASNPVQAAQGINQQALNAAIPTSLSQDSQKPVYKEEAPLARIIELAGR